MTRSKLGLMAAVALLAAPALADVTVEVGHGSLDPAEVRIEAGETVTFENVQAMPGGHTVVADDGSFRSHGLAQGETYTERFEEPGRYPYHIAEHPSGKGVIIVE